MQANLGTGLLALTVTAVMTQAVAGEAPADAAAIMGVQKADDPSGVLGVVSLTGPTHNAGPFFQSLGTNGRSCSTCHLAEQAFSFNAAGARERFAASGGRDPLFAPVDGANCPNLPRHERAAHSLLLHDGLIRVGITLPAKMEFSIRVVHDPYGCALIPDPAGGPPTVSVYRRPLPSANLVFLSAVMFDGRETLAPLASESDFFANLVADLTHQAMDATLGHAQAAQSPTARQLSEIVDFEMGLYTAQLRDDGAGNLAARGARGGPFHLADQPYYPGVNDSLGADPDGKPFDSSAMTLFARWLQPHRDDSGDEDSDDQIRDGPADSGRRDTARRAIAAGEELFNSAPMSIANVRGLNDNAALGKPASFTGHCTSCHDTPNVGNHSLPLPLDIGTAHSARAGMESDPAIAAALAQLSTPDLPVYRIDGCPNPFGAGEPESFYTTDPGKALVTGACSDFNRIKGPILRGLAARAPYFHNGAAADLSAVVNFYNERFSMRLTDEQKSDLVAFLKSL
jgi:cytochrome c peroxidase